MSNKQPNFTLMIVDTASITYGIEFVNDDLTDPLDYIDNHHLKGKDVDQSWEDFKNLLLTKKSKSQNPN